MIDALIGIAGLIGMVMAMTAFPKFEGARWWQFAFGLLLMLVSTWNYQLQGGHSPDRFPVSGEWDGR